MDSFVHGLFKDEARAALAVQALIEADYDPRVISALMRVGGDFLEAAPSYKIELGREAALGAALGMVGATVLATGGFLVAGPLLAAVAGAETGAVAGALGALGRWKDEINFPAEADRNMILVGVSTNAHDVERASVALAKAQPERIHICEKAAACEEVHTGILAPAGETISKRSR